MSKNWSKEDRYHFERSEVMQGLETIVLDTIKRVDILQEKIARSKEELEKKALSPDAQKTVNDLKVVEQAGHDAAEAVGAVISGADDGGAIDDAYADDETAEDALQDEVVDDLRDLVAAALLDGNIKLAYRIERTIDEILEQDAPCL